MARLGAATAGLAAVAIFAAPASAADPSADLGITLNGTTIAATADEKTALVTVVNNGPDKPTGVVVTIDTTALDTTKVDVVVDPECTAAAGVITCPQPDEDAPPADGSLEIGITLDRKPAASGAAGSLTASVAAATADPNTANNEVTANVVVGTPGADLAVVALDVYEFDESVGFTTNGVPPGDSSFLLGGLENQGDLASVGLELVVTLPEHVTFAEIFSDCEYSSDNRVATCTAPDIVFPPGTGLPLIVFEVTVSESAPGPVALTGGSMAVAAFDVQQPEVPEIAPQGQRLPGFLRTTMVPDLPSDVDPTDNQDPFTVFVGEEPDLPVTGAKAGLYATSGAGLLLLGTLIVLLARRRRRAGATTA